ncbi:hypothetical protein K2X85_20265, partial [bacterium]|nr:hypothetical protein [bacterium]
NERRAGATMNARQVPVVVMMIVISASRADETYGVGEGSASKTNLPAAKRDDDGVWRQPIRAILNEATSTLWVLCQRSPSLMKMPLNDTAPRAILPLSGRPESMVWIEGGTLAITDSQRDIITLFDTNQAPPKVTAEIAVGEDPRELLVGKDGKSLFVSCRSAQQVQRIDLAQQKIAWTCDLAYSPHCLAQDIGNTVLMVADAFRGMIAVVDPTTGEKIAAHQFPGTNIRGMAFTADDEYLVFTHQIISENSIIERETVRWGSFITNNVRRVRKEVITSPSIDAAKNSDLGFVGGFGHGAGDPGKLLIPSTNRWIVCLTGVQEIGIDTGWPLRFDRVRVGRRPIDVVVDHAGKRAYVVNMFDDAISVVDLETSQVIESMSLGPMPEETAAMRGEVLFHDSRISLDSWYSCQSCHTDGETNNSNSDTFSDGGFGSPKNTPSLRGVRQTGPWSWVGRFNKLEEQIASTIEHTMQSNYVSSQRAEDLAEYLATLEPRTRRRAEAGSVEWRGRAVFETQGCADCHAGERFTKETLEDVGMDDGLAGHHLFNPPSLRSLKLTAPYFHDGRATSLEEVIDKFGHRLTRKLADDERAELLAYLRSL